MVPTPAKGTPPHTTVPPGMAEQTAWTPWARSLPSVPARQVPGPQEPTLPQNVTLPWWCLALLQLLLGWILSGPAGSSTARSCRSLGCLWFRRRVCSAHSPAVCLRGAEGPSMVLVGTAWARRGHSEHRRCSLLAALSRPCHVPVPVPGRVLQLCPCPSPSICSPAAARTEAFRTPCCAHGRRGGTAHGSSSWESGYGDVLWGRMWHR